MNRCYHGVDGSTAPTPLTVIVRRFILSVCAGPMFQGRLAVALGEIVERDNFVFADILAENEVVPGESALQS